MVFGMKKVASLVKMLKTMVGGAPRLKWLDREEKYLGETGIYEAHNIVKNDIHHLYMNFNNICNFKCRMCGPILVMHG